jgi:cardiolipin synthase
MIFISYCAGSNFYFYYHGISNRMFSAKKRNSFYTLHNKFQIVEGGSQYFNFLKQFIEKAKYSIYIRIYIWDGDATGNIDCGELIKAAKKYISVFVIADGNASQCLSKEFTKHLKKT